jgi:predicted exporter/predicted O-methyltransferase YrrM
MGNTKNTDVFNGMDRKKTHIPLLIIIVVATALLLVAAICRLNIDTDVAASLPKDDGVLADAVYIFKNHPIQNQIAIDIGTDKPDKNFLVKVANQIEDDLLKSGLFTKVGMDDMQQIIPLLIGHVVDYLPYLFSEQELTDQVAPLLSPQAVEKKFKERQLSLMGFDGIGQAGLMARDPLGLRELKLADLAALAPAPNVQIYKNKLLSADGRHVMILAQPSGSGTDTVFARQMTDVIDGIDAAIHKSRPDGSGGVTITPVGAYRTALDNETMVRRDVNKAIVLATLAIAVLLLLAFPRPLIGLLALVPALVGTTTALFVYSLFNESISIMALGFGGGVISITVDHGIAYLLFLDRPEETSGKYASREVWAIGLLAVLTTIGAFMVLSFSGFLIFKQLGIFTAMGIAFSFLFVHAVFPRIFPLMSPVRTSRGLPLQGWADNMANLGVKGGLAALVAAAILIFWAKPNFNVDLATMNSVSESTRSAESLFSDVWGDIFSKIYLMTEGPTIESLQEKGDRLMEEMESARRAGDISSAFVTASLFPGKIRKQGNLAAWHRFWSPQRVEQLRTVMARASMTYGFSEAAFKPFFHLLTAPANDVSIVMDSRYHALLGISHNQDDGMWRQITSVTTGPDHNGESFYARFSPLAKVFDAELFSKKMGRLLFATFGRMLLIIGISVVVLLFIFFADWRLTLISLLPMAFALVCTLGILGLLGRSLDIPALMLAIIVFGLGIDYSLFFVRSYQRYQSADHPNFSLIRMSVLMASMSTLIGFGVLCGAEHTLLKSAGLSSLMGIGFSLLGAFLILPPLLKRRFSASINNIPVHTNGSASIPARYRNMEPYPRYFAKIKLRTDPMFKEIEEIAPKPEASIRTIVDIGTGYGVPACWLLQRYPNARVFGIEPDPGRVRVANLALGRDGNVELGHAPDVPNALRVADAAFLLDMCHFLDADDFQLTLTRLHDKLKDGGRVIIRAVLVPNSPSTWAWRVDQLRMKWQGVRTYHRTLTEVVEIVKQNKFEILKTQFSGNQEDMAWVVAGKPENKNAGGGQG